MGTDNVRNKKTPSGRGGNIDKRPNPFSRTESKGEAPTLSAVTNLGATLDQVLACGCALMIGHTRDGGAVVITVLDGTERYRTYCATEEELDAGWLALWEMYKEE